jgi:hypothetical protein
VEQKYAETLSKMMGNLSPLGEGRGEGEVLFGPEVETPTIV